MRQQRNAKCACGSGLKYKKCCGLGKSTQAVAYSNLSTLYTPSQRAAAHAFLVRWGFVPHPSQLYTAMKEDDDSQVNMVLRVLGKLNAPPELLHAVRGMRRMATPRNLKYWSQEDREEFNRLVREYKESEHGRDEGSVGVPAGEVRA